jgi:hypothetical protein
VVGLAAALVGCGPAPAPAPPPAPPAAPVQGADLRGGPFAEIRSDRFGLSFALPDGRAWQVDDRQEHWLTARHAASGSLLVVRTWREDENATRDRCEQKARLWRDLPKREGADVFARKRVDVPRGFDTRVELGVVPAAAGAPVGGFAMAFGGSAKRCFAFVYTTSAAGPGAETLLADRLAAMTESLETVAQRSALAPEIPRAPAR